MGPQLLKLLGELTSSPGMLKMSQIDAKAKALGLDDEYVTQTVQHLCGLVITNLDKPDQIREFINHIIDGAIEGGPELIKALAALAQKGASNVETG